MFIDGDYRRIAVSCSAAIETKPNRYFSAWQQLRRFPHQPPTPGAVAQIKGDL